MYIIMYTIYTNIDTNCIEKGDILLKELTDHIYKHTYQF